MYIVRGFSQPNTALNNNLYRNDPCVNCYDAVQRSVLLYLIQNVCKAQGDNTDVVCRVIYNDYTVFNVKLAVNFSDAE